MNDINISEFIIWFFNQIINIFTNIFNLLDRIKIANNISILDISITILIIGTILPIIITLVKSRKITGRGQN